MESRGATLVCCVRLLWLPTLESERKQKWTHEIKQKHKQHHSTNALLNWTPTATNRQIQTVQIQLYRKRKSPIGFSALHRWLNTTSLGQYAGLSMVTSENCVEIAQMRNGLAIYFTGIKSSAHVYVDCAPDVEMHWQLAVGGCSVAPGL